MAFYRSDLGFRAGSVRVGFRQQKRSNTCSGGSDPFPQALLPKPVSRKWHVLEQYPRALQVGYYDPDSTSHPVPGYSVHISRISLFLPLKRGGGAEPSFRLGAPDCDILRRHHILERQRLGKYLVLFQHRAYVGFGLKVLCKLGCLGS